MTNRGVLALWPASVAGLRPAATPDVVTARLAGLVSAATLRYLTHSHGQPVLLVHTATAPTRCCTPCQRCPPACGPEPDRGLGRHSSDLLQLRPDAWCTTLSPPALPATA